MKKKILIVGGSGFIGKNLIKALNHSEYEILSASRKIPKKKDRIKNIKYISLDISKKRQLKKIKNKIEYVINLGGNIDHSNKIKTFNSHYIGCKNLVDHFIDKKLLLFIQIGSSLEYGKVKNPHTEDQKCKPNSYYGLSKYNASKYLLKKNIPNVILRLYQVYGSYQKKNRLISSAIDAFLKGKCFKSTSGKQYRDFLHISDLTSLIKKILKKKKINHGIYNVGSGQKMQVSKILKITKSLIRNGELELGRLRMRKDEMIYNYPKITKVEKEFKWKSKISIKNGLIKTIKYYESI